MPKLSVSYLATDQLVPYVGNAKEHPDWQVKQIANSIAEFGFNDPIGVWHDPEGQTIILEGHGRLLAAQHLGMAEVPVLVLDHLSDEQRRAYVHVHNQTTLTSGFDMELLEKELASIDGYDWSDFGFELEDVLEDLPDYDPEEDQVPSVPAEPRTKPGDLWVMGRHRLLCGDSTDPAQVARLMGGREADLLLTDPPYNVAYNQNKGGGEWGPQGGKARKDGKIIANDSFADELAFQRFLEDALTAAYGVMRQGAAWYVWFAALHEPAVHAALNEAGLEVRQEIIWVKNHFTLGRQDYQWMHEPCLYGWKGGATHYFAPTRSEVTVVDDTPNLNKMSKPEMRRLLQEFLQGETQTSVLRYDKPLASEAHPTMKPVPLFSRLVRNSSRRGEAVLDLFGGSGTTAIACEQLGRDAYLMELDPAYCDVIIERWEQLTGGTATLAKE